MCLYRLQKNTIGKYNICHCQECIGKIGRCGSMEFDMVWRLDANGNYGSDGGRHNADEGYTNQPVSFLLYKI